MFREGASTLVAARSASYRVRFLKTARSVAFSCTFVVLSESIVMFIRLPQITLWPVYFCSLNLSLTLSEHILRIILKSRYIVSLVLFIFDFSWAFGNITVNFHFSSMICLFGFLRRIVVGAAWSRWHLGSECACFRWLYCLFICVL